MLSQTYAPLTNRTLNINERSYATDSARKQVGNRKHTSKYSSNNFAS